MAGLGFNRYGKADVRILRVLKDSPRHEVHELQAMILLEGEFTEAWTKGDNTQIVATETQKNTLYVLAKKYSVDPIEEWTINVAKDFMSRYSHISAVNMEVEEQSWDRIVVDGQQHNHAFRKGSGGTRICTMRLSKSGELSMSSGFKDLQVMKTTQSGFEGYIKDEYTTLKDTHDRILSTKIKCTWKYVNSGKGFHGLSKNAQFGYSQIYEEMQRICVSIFAGDPRVGTYSPSVQQTIYDIGMAGLKKFSDIDSVSFILPNIHYYFVDFNQFKTNLKNNLEVFYTFDGAHGFIEGTVDRNPPKAKL